MTELTTRTRVRCPLREASSRLAQYFERFGSLDGNIVQLKLDIDRSRLDRAGRPRSFSSIIVSVTPVLSRDGSSTDYGVRWAAGSGGPCPAFAGELGVESEADDECFYLCFRGDYTVAPLAIGPQFNAHVARNIAKRTITAMLISIADDIERQVGVDERAMRFASRRP